MKALKYILLLLLIVVIALGIYTAVQPNEYDVKRTQLIKAPTDLVFNNVNDFKNWESWGPWYDDDPTIETTYPENTSGEGASYSWTSKDGPGNMKTVGVEKNKMIAQKLQFADYEPTDTFWRFEETPEGTNVTWQMKADEVPFMFKFFGVLSGGMDNMLGPMMERGLVKMDSVMQLEVKAYEEKMANAFKIGDIKEMDMQEQKFIGYPHKAKMDHEVMTNLFMESLPKAGAYAMQHLEYGEFTPAAVFTNWDEEKGEVEFMIGLVLNKDLAPDGAMQSMTLPAGKTVMVSKFGQYGTGDEKAHMAIDAYLKEHNFTQNGPVWEMYVNDPTQVKEIEIQTDIYYPVKGN
ncbi:GyrI-like domain-containing protein [Winogradskyella sp. 3972H.M.0a.05]|uniref:SRPBCC family protein n=1 Tax=Winogradskyella sp. 3972H.M.0a.05 TaxID=2950277 RepID=UPI003392C90D